MPDERYKRILGLGSYRPETKYVCFLPWVSEFGWYLMNHVKRFHGYNHPNKIACIKPGHECLFPSASKFFYDWKDPIPDIKKGGIADIPASIKGKLKTKIRKKYSQDITFIDPIETSWAEKVTLARHTFIPKPSHNHHFSVDIVITPRLREVEKTRNYRHWQKIIDAMAERQWTIAACGAKETSYSLNGLKYLSWDYIDVDTDVELMLASKVIITQESGLAYLAMMCQKPIIYIDKRIKKVADAHRHPRIFFKELPYVWNNIDELINTIRSLFLIIAN